MRLERPSSRDALERASRYDSLVQDLSAGTAGMSEREELVKELSIFSDCFKTDVEAVADFILAREDGLRYEWIEEVKRYGNEIARLRSALEKLRDSCMHTVGCRSNGACNCEVRGKIGEAYANATTALQGGSDA